MGGDTAGLMETISVWRGYPKTMPSLIKVSIYHISDISEGWGLQLSMALRLSMIATPIRIQDLRSDSGSSRLPTKREMGRGPKLRALAHVLSEHTGFLGDFIKWPNVI